MSIGKAVWGEKQAQEQTEEGKPELELERKRKGQKDFRRTNLAGLKPPMSNGAERMREGTEAPSSAHTRANQGRQPFHWINPHLRGKINVEHISGNRHWRRPQLFLSGENRDCWSSGVAVGQCEVSMGITSYHLLHPNSRMWWASSQECFSGLVLFRLGS